MKRDSAAGASPSAATSLKNSRLDNLLIASCRLSLCVLQLCVFCDRTHNCVFAGDANDSFNFLTLAEEHQSWNALDAVNGSGCRVLVNVQLYHRNCTEMFLSNCLNRWCQHATRSAPLGPEIDQHRFVCLQYFSLKRIVRYFLNCLAHFPHTPQIQNLSCHPDRVIPQASVFITQNHTVLEQSFQN